MFEPKYTSTSAIDFGLGQMDLSRFRIERILIMPKHEAWLRREAVVRSALYSTMIENPSITEDEVAGAVQAATVESPASKRPDVANVESALMWTDFVGDDSDVPIDERLIRNLNWLVMQGLPGAKNPGQYRSEPNWIEDRGTRVYESPYHGDVPHLMHEFSDWLKSDLELHPALRAGIAHVWLVAIHPFVDGNGRTARLLSTLVLQRHGFGFRKFLSLDAYYARNRDGYIEALQGSLGPRFNPHADLTPWLEYFCRSIGIQASFLEDTLTRWRMMMDELHRDLRPLGLSERQIDGFVYALRMGYVTRKDYMAITGVSALTATRDLAQLVEKGQLRAVGAGRNRRFIRVGPPRERQPEGQQDRLL